MTLSVFLATFLGSLIAMVTTVVVFMTAYLPLARRLKMGSPEKTVGWPFDADGSGSNDTVDDPEEAFAREGEPDLIHDRAPRSRRPTERLPEEWTDEWGPSEPQTSEIHEDARHGTIWAIGIVPVGERTVVIASESIFVGKPQDDVRVGIPRTGKFSGSEIEVDAECAASFAICDVLVRGASQIWERKATERGRVARRTGEIPAEAFSRDPYGVIPMDPAAPEDEIGIVVRNIASSPQEFRAAIRGAYRVDSDPDILRKPEKESRDLHRARSGQSPRGRQEEST